ncbi:7TM receptor with intracellular metal dependent phosphohydrolase [Halothece sp. PCC 7418]|nr:7TM receptor with intracellular metal dependent phosphohydrolase [Halothece sp. PCC 7418]
MAQLNLAPQGDLKLMKHSPSITHRLAHHPRNRLSLQQWLGKQITAIFTSGSWLIFLLAVLSLTGVVGNRLYNQPQLAIGTKAPETIIAPSQVNIKDDLKTAQKQETARSRLTPILKVDQGKNEAILRSLNSKLDALSAQREQAGAVLFAPTKQLSESVQVYLRTCSQTAWESLLSNLDSTSPQGQSLSEQAQSQLAQLSEDLSSSEFSQLLSQIEQARQQYRTTLYSTATIHDQETSWLSSTQRRVLLSLSPSDWQTTRTAIEKTARQMLAQGIAPGLPPSVFRSAIPLQLEEKVPASAIALSSEILRETLTPNLVEDTPQTERRAEAIASAVDPVMLRVEAGEAIVTSGEVISREQFLLLDALGLSQRGVSWDGLFLCGMFVTGAIALFWWVKRVVKRQLRRRDQILLILLSVASPLLLMLGVPYSCLPAVGLLVSSFYGPSLALTQVSLVTGLEVYTLLSGQSVPVAWEALITGAVGGLLAAGIAGRLRSREELALLGGAIGLVEGAVYLLLGLILNTMGETIWYAMLPDAVIYGLSGLVWSIVAFGVSPYLERFFDLVTPIRLAELANPNRPLLQRLAIEAPGTFQHTLFVASLAEAAARELNCNVELVRAGTLYHDIGKMHDPLGFIENQMGCKNKHDEINDPYASAKIIKKHVSEGLVMARRCGLPKAIQDFIPEHQGTLLISYFYFQAQKESQETVLESDFRYDGPTPQSRETGIVMLADGCEAALRSLSDVSPEKALAMVNKIIRSRWQDNQLKDANLTRTELKKVAQVFVRVWQQTNHKRIAYPKAALDAKYSSSLKK